MIYGKALFTAIWATVNFPIFGKVKLGTPLLFDLGVYLVVIGAVLGILLSLAEAEE
jgi:multicomponent Na+:H+ antiporter subunit B